MNTSHDIKPPNQSRTGSSSQHQQQQQQDQQGDRRPASMVHSTHSHLETFDQATRDQLQEQQSKSSSSWLDQDHPLANKQPASAVDSDMGFQEANSGVQLDRDVQRSRRVADESKQKASGSGREGSRSGNQSTLPYVE